MNTEQILNKMDIVMPLGLWGIFFGVILGMLLWISIILIVEWIKNKRIYNISYKFSQVKLPENKPYTITYNNDFRVPHGIYSGIDYVPFILNV